MASDTDAPTAIALPILRAGARTTGACFQWGPALSYPRLQILMCRAETWSRLNAKSLHKPRHFPIGRKARAATARQQQRFRSHICKRRTRDRNAGFGGIPNQARDQARNFEQNKLRAACGIQT